MNHTILLTNLGQYCEVSGWSGVSTSGYIRSGCSTIKTSHSTRSGCFSCVNLMFQFSDCCLNVVSCGNSLVSTCWGITLGVTSKNCVSNVCTANTNLTIGLANLAYILTSNCCVRYIEFANLSGNLSINCGLNIVNCKTTRTYGKNILSGLSCSSTISIVCCINLIALTVNLNLNSLCCAVNLKTVTSINTYNTSVAYRQTITKFTFG